MPIEVVVPATAMEESMGAESCVPDVRLIFKIVADLESFCSTSLYISNIVMLLSSPSSFLDMLLSSAQRCSGSRAVSGAPMSDCASCSDATGSMAVNVDVNTDVEIDRS
jgi:hypothetical protein